MERTAIYLTAYDIRYPRPLRLALHVLLDYALGRQKCVFECLLDGNEPTELIQRIEEVIDSVEVRFALVRLEHRGANHVLGKSVPLELGDIFYIG